MFLSGAWRFLAMLNFRIDPAVVLPYVPAGTELETWQGDSLISVVGFRFENTRVLGVPLPFHRNFTEVNLRIYVTRRLDAEVRRGVTFIREIVPRRAIAAVARLAYRSGIDQILRFFFEGHAEDFMLVVAMVRRLQHVFVAGIEKEPALNMRVAEKSERDGIGHERLEGIPQGHQVFVFIHG